MIPIFDSHSDNDNNLFVCASTLCVCVWKINDYSMIVANGFELSVVGCSWAHQCADVTSQCNGSLRIAAASSNGSSPIVQFNSFSLASESHGGHTHTHSELGIQTVVIVRRKTERERERQWQWQNKSCSSKHSNWEKFSSLFLRPKRVLTTPCWPADYCTIFVSE